MSDHDRGAYTPPSERLSFDPREPVRSGGPAPVTLIVSGLVLVAILGGVFLLYKGGTRHKGEGPTVVGAPITQMKTPAAPDANAMPPGLVIDKAGPSNAANPVSGYAPAPEQPLPRPLPVAEAPVAQALPPPLVHTVPTPPPAPVATHSAAQPPPHAVKPVTIASLTDAAMAQKPAAKAPAAPPPPMVTPPPVVATTAAAPPTGQGWVQIGAYSSAALADKGWSDVAHLAPAAMGGKGKRVEQLSKDGKTLYRAYITGFSSRDGATAFCGKLKAGGRACFVK